MFFGAIPRERTNEKGYKFSDRKKSQAFGREEADWDTDDYARFVNEYLRQQGYNKVDINYVDDYPEGTADEQAALREEVDMAYRTRRSNNPTDKDAR